MTRPPAWYHPALGVLAGGLVASGEWHRLDAFVAALLVYLVGSGVLVSSYGRLTGASSSALRRGRPRRVSLQLVGGVYVVLGLAAVLGLTLALPGAFVVGGVAALVLVVVLGARFDDAVGAGEERTVA